MNSPLFKRVVRLAHQNPKLRPKLLPLLKKARWESGEDVPLSALPEELQDNAEDPPPEAKALKKKMKDKSAGETFQSWEEVTDFYESSTGVDEGPLTLHLDAGMWIDADRRGVQLHNSATDDSEMLKYPFSKRDLEQAAKRVWPRDNIRHYERFASIRRSASTRLVRRTLRLAAENKALRPKLLAALKQSNRPPKKAAGLFPGATGTDAGRPIYPEDHREFRYAEEAAYQDGMVAAASGAAFRSNPYKYKPYKEAWKDGFRDGKKNYPV